MHLEPPDSRLGVAVYDAKTGAAWGHRQDERFLMCSTFKLPLAALVLRQWENGVLSLEEQLTYSSDDLVPHAPVTGPRLSEGRMSVLELTQAAHCQSDNVAANLLLRRLGGVEAYTRFCRALGDSVTRLDRYEPMLNLGSPGDDRDTTSPAATAKLVSRFFDGQVLGAESRRLLRSWMMETQTGSSRLRAGFPRDWKAGDKTGTSVGDAATSRYNDVACVWFTDDVPLVVAAYLETKTVGQEMRAEDQLVLARVGHVVGLWKADNESS